MGKNNQRTTEPAAPPITEASAYSIEIDEILATLSSLKGLSEDAAKELGYKPGAVNREVLACEAATAILSALQDEGIKDPDGVRDLVHDYNALAEQYRKMHQHYEEPAKLNLVGSAYICPKCHRHTYYHSKYCWNCGKRIGWGR